MEVEDLDLDLDLDREVDFDLDLDFFSLRREELLCLCGDLERLCFLEERCCNYKRNDLFPTRYRTVTDSMQTLEEVEDLLFFFSSASRT